MTVLKFYKSTLSFLLGVIFGGGCRFTPTCSEYAYQAVSTHGVLRGAGLAVRRIIRCHPWGGRGFDPIPEDTRHGPASKKSV